MSQIGDQRLAELLVSRLCHDLAAPVGAVENGLELMTDAAPAPNDAEIVALLRSSARRAVGVVRFHRMAWGQAGELGLASLADLREASEGWLHDLPFVVQWPAAASVPAFLPGQGRAILNGIALARQMLPRGGTIRLALAQADGELEVAIEANGPAARLDPSIAAAHDPESDSTALTPVTIQAHFAARLVRRLGGTASLVQAGGERVIVQMRLPMRGA